MSIQIEIAFADEQTQIVIPISVPDICSVETALQYSGVLIQLPRIDLTKNKVGIFGKICPLSTFVQSGDRVEIYRSLMIDPKKNRKNRAQRQTERN
jgi:putative ubiquitin-RnfH superfamily antitoxin RatB of RatAB toxin-antitoxin module